MGFTVEAIEAAAPASSGISEPNQFDLPSKEFIGYDKSTVTKKPEESAPQGDVKQENTPETTQPVENVPNEESVTLSPKISAIARKEQAQRQRERALIQREKALSEKLADAEKYAKLKAGIANKDYSTAEELGMTYEQHLQYQLDKKAGENPDEQRARRLEAEVEQLKKAQEESTVREFEANQALWKQEIAKVVDANEEYSTVKELGLQGLVLRIINDAFDEDGIELTVEQAAAMVEEEGLRRAEKFSSVTKIKKRLEDAPKVLGAPKASPKTITQNMTVTSEKVKSKPFHLMSESEQIAEAYRRVQAAKNSR